MSENTFSPGKGRLVCKKFRRLRIVGFVAAQLGLPPSASSEYGKRGSGIAVPFRLAAFD
jgi:hypothetical protein